MIGNGNEESDRESEGRDGHEILKSSVSTAFYIRVRQLLVTRHTSLSACLSVFPVFELLFLFSISFIPTACSGFDRESGELTLNTQRSSSARTLEEGECCRVVLKCAPMEKRHVQEAVLPK